MKGKSGRYVSACVLLGLLALSMHAIATERTPTGFVCPIGVGSWDHACGGWLERSSPNGCYSAGYYHIGEDMLAGLASSVYAISDGDIARIWTTNASDDSYLGTGNSVMFVKHRLQDGSYFLAEYMHVRPTVWSGHVVAGQEIAKVGPWYNATHLHFGIHPDTVVPTTSWGRMANGAWPNTNGFVDPVDWIRTRTPWSDCTPASVSWTSLPAQVWYRTDQRLTYSVGGTDVSVQENPGDGSIGDMYLSQKPCGANHYGVHVSNACNSTGSDIDWIGYWDNCPPAASRSGGAAPGTWYTTSQTVTWSLSDANSGVRRHWYSWNGTDWTPGNGSAPLEEGRKTLQVRVEDNAYNGDPGQQGNIATVSLGEYLLDTVAPEVSIAASPASPNGGDGWYVTRPSLTISASDATSQVAQSYYTVDGGNPVPCSDPVPALEGIHAYRGAADDHATNRGWSGTITAKVDTTPPTVAAVLAPTQPDGENGWYETTPTLDVEAADPNGADGSGIAGRFYTLDGAAEAVFSSQETIAGDGEHTLSVRATDVAGNSATTEPQIVKVDTTPPSQPVVDTAAESGCLNILVAAVSSSDPHSGVCDYQYWIGTSPGEDDACEARSTCGNPWVYAQNLNLVPGQSYYFTVRAKNHAGLWGEPVTSGAIVATGGVCEPSPNLNAGGTSVETRISENYRIVDSLGQFVVDSSASPSFVIEHGHWHSDLSIMPVLSIGDAKAVQDGKTVSLGNTSSPVVVTTGTALLADRFYVEQPSRSSGMALQYGASGGPALVEGDRIWISSGQTSTVDGERVIRFAVPVLVDHADPLTPLYLSTPDLGGGALNAWTPGVTGGIGLTNVGLLVKTFGGFVSHRDPQGRFFYVDNGDNLYDGYGYGLRVVCDGFAGGSKLTMPVYGKQVIITGISSVVTVNSKPVRAIRPRQQIDIQILN